MHARPRESKSHNFMVKTMYNTVREPYIPLNRAMEFLHDHRKWSYYDEANN